MLLADVPARDVESVDNQFAQTHSLAFLHEHICAHQHGFSPDEQDVLCQVQQALKQADSIIICLGGRSGRLGECLVGTGLLEGLLLALRLVGKAGTPLHVLIDQGVVDLFAARLYQERFWPRISVHAAPVGKMLVQAETLIHQSGERHILVVDLHGAHDGMPALHRERRRVALSPGSSHATTQTVTTLDRLFRLGVRSYARRGAERRYADFIEALFALPVGALDGALAQPRIRLGAADEARYPALADDYGLRASASLIVCFFQSIVPAKCYGRWREVLTLVCQQVAQRFPQQQLDFLIACGPDEDLPAGVKLAEVAEEFADFSGVRQNARVLVRATPSLRDLAIIVRHAALVLSNDTGPGHLAGALQVPTIVPYLPGHVYSKAVWASTLWHHGVTLEPNPFSARHIEAAVLWDSTDIIDSIPAEHLVTEALEKLTNHLLSGGYRTPRASAIPDGRARSTSAARCPPHPQEK